MADWVPTIARFVHVIAAMLWYGGGIFFGVVAFPGIRKLAGRPRLEALHDLTTRAGPFFGIAGGVVFLSGFWLAELVFGTLNPLDWEGNSGMAIMIGSFLAIVTMAIGSAHRMLDKKLQGVLAGTWNKESEAAGEGILKAANTLGIITGVLLFAITFLMVGGSLRAF